MGFDIDLVANFPQKRKKNTRIFRIQLVTKMVTNSQWPVFADKGNWFVCLDNLDLDYSNMFMTYKINNHGLFEISFRAERCKYCL